MEEDRMAVETTERGFDMVLVEKLIKEHRIDNSTALKIMQDLGTDVRTLGITYGPRKRKVTQRNWQLLSLRYRGRMTLEKAEAFLNEWKGIEHGNQ